METDIRSTLAVSSDLVVGVRLIQRLVTSSRRSSPSNRSSSTQKFSTIKCRLLLVAFPNRQRRTNGKAQCSGKRRCKCGIIVMVSHRIRSGQSTRWQQDNDICITLREKRAIVAQKTPSSLLRQGGDETIKHLFSECACAAACWDNLIGH